MIRDIVPLYKDTDTLIDAYDATATYEQHHTHRAFNSLGIC
jgi:hypothetical protein